MARLDDLPTQVMLQNGKKIFVQKIAITTTPSQTTIATQDAEGNGLEAGATLMYQSDVDFFYQTTTGAVAASVTNLAGSRPGTFVPGQSQEFAHKGLADTKVEAVASTTSGTLVVYHVV